MTPEQALAHCTRVADGFAPLVRANIMLFSEAADAIDRLLWTDPRFVRLGDKILWRISELSHVRICEIASSPQLIAARAIRASLAPMIEAKRPRVELTLAAYRAADGRIPSGHVERIVADEIAAYLVRIKQSKGVNNGR